MDPKSAAVKSIAWNGMPSLNASGGGTVRAIYDVVEASKDGNVYTLKATTYLTRLPKESTDYSTLTLEQCEVAEDLFDLETYCITFDESSSVYTFDKIDSKSISPEDFVRSLLFNDD